MILNLNIGGLSGWPANRLAVCSVRPACMPSQGVFNAMRFAQKEAELEGAPFVDTVHLLLGLINEAYSSEGTDTINTGIFNFLQLRHSTVFDKAQNFAGLEARDLANIASSWITVAAKRLFLTSARIAQGYFSPVIKPEHILLALCKRENMSCSAYGTFIELGIDPEELKNIIERS